MGALIMIADIELDLLGAAIMDPRITSSITLRPDQFDSPVRGAVWAAIRSLSESGTAVTPVLVAEEVAQLGVRMDPGLIVELVGRAIPASAESYASRIVDAATRRTITDAMASAVQQLESGRVTDSVVGDLMSKINSTTADEGELDDLMTVDEFSDQPLPPEEWIVPNLIARGDRLVITGGEGAGKSMLIRQIAICCAAGLHPFTFVNTPPKNVLVVDAENPKRIMVDRFTELRNSVRHRGLTTAQRMWITRRPGGLDLGQSHDRLDLHNLCMLTNPDLLVIGPAYKLYTGGSANREEDLARRVTSTLDGLREEFGFSLILEHHSPHATPGHKRSTRPIGSSLWLRWPEFGFGITLDEDSTFSNRSATLSHWRGGRDGRPWPERLMSSTMFPWIDATPSRPAGDQDRHLRVVD